MTSAVSRAHAIGALTLAVSQALPSTRPLGAQDRLFPARTVSVGPVFERWSFGSGLLQPTADGGGDVELKTVSSLAFPIGGSLAIGERWTIDVSTSYANGTVQLRSNDPTLGKDTYTLSGLTNVARASTK